MNKQELVSEWKKSGRSKQDFAIDKGINPSTFRRWTLKETEASEFVSKLPSHVCEMCDIKDARIRHLEGLVCDQLITSKKGIV